MLYMFHVGFETLNYFGIFSNPWKKGNLCTGSFYKNSGWSDEVTFNEMWNSAQEPATILDQKSQVFVSRCKNATIDEI